MKNKTLLVIFGIAVAGITGAGSIYASTHREELSVATRAAMHTLGVQGETELNTDAGDANNIDEQHGDSRTKSNASEHEKSVEKDTQTSTTVRSHEQENTSGREEEDEDDNDDDTDGNASARTTATTPSSTQSGSQNVASPETVFTMTQIAAHHSKADCYTTIGGLVYDLTPFITAHPGGVAAISSLCGIDGTAAFTAQHGGQGNPAQELATLKIGVLAK